MLAAVLAFTGFVKPGFLRPKRPDPGYVNPSGGNTSVAVSDGQGNDARESDARDDDWRELSDEVVPYGEVIGNSRAIRDTPCEGVTVSAEENAFWQDTEIRFTPVDDSTEGFSAVEDELFEQGYLSIAAWEVDAGLQDDETIPGEYDVEIDLSTLEIDPSMYEAVRVLRVSDSGEYYVYASSLEGSKLSFSSNQNSVLVTAILLGLLGATVVGVGVNEYITRNKYYVWDRKFDPLKGDVESVHRTTKYGSFCVEWVMEEVDPQLADKAARMTEIEKAYKQEAEEYRKVLNVFERFRSNYHVAEHYRQSLEGDQEYRRLLKELKMPELIEYTVQCIETAYDYLGRVQMLYMPKHEVAFKIMNNEGPLGEAINRTYSSAYVELRLKPLQSGDQTERDDYLLTITHELFHICQNRYRLRVDLLTNSTRFDEMAAIYLESEARDYYQDKNIIKTEPKLVNYHYWGTLRIPVDVYPDVSNTVMIHEGYNLGVFAMYLSDNKVEKRITARNIMIARTYLGIPGSSVSKPEISKTLCSAFGLSPKQLDEYYREWLLSERLTIKEYVYDAYIGNVYKMPRWVIVQPGKKHHYNTAKDEAYFLGLQLFVQATKKTAQPAILVPDADLASKHPEVTVVPAADYYQTSKGMFVPAYVDYNQAYDMLGIMEIHGAAGKASVSGDSGVTLYVLDKTGKPVVVDDRENRRVLVSFPEPSEAAKDRVVEGYCVYVLTTSGVNKRKFIEFPEGRFDKTIALNYDDLADKDDPSNPVEVTITLCEYATNIMNQKKLLGIESDQVTILVTPEAKKEEAALKPFYGAFESNEPYNNPLLSSAGNWVRADVGDELSFEDYLQMIYNHFTEKPVLDLKANGDFTITYAGNSFVFDQYKDSYNGGAITVDGFSISGHVTMGRSFREMGFSSDKVNTPLEWIADDLKMEPSVASAVTQYKIQYWYSERPCPSEYFEEYGIVETKRPEFDRYDFELKEYLELHKKTVGDGEVINQSDMTDDWTVEDRTFGCFYGESPY